MDVRGKTTLRELIRLVYHAQGVLCPVSLVMHLAAAVECKPGQPGRRPSVIVAGGREPPNWEAYPDHHFIHTIGMLPCCEQGGCWRSRSVPLGDGDAKDQPNQLCVDVVANLPRCMHLITPAEVVQRIELCNRDPPLSGPSKEQAVGLARLLSRRPSPAGVIKGSRVRGVGRKATLETKS